MDRRRFLTGLAGVVAVLPAELRGLRRCGAAAGMPPSACVRVGCCTNQFATETDLTGVDSIHTLKQVGFDYIELPLAPLMTLDASGFESFESRIKAAGIPCEACGNFLPPSVRIAGPGVEAQRIADYVEPALKRAARLGARVVVCGSPGSRNLPPDFPVEKAWEQMVGFLRSIDRLSGANGIIIAVEAINRGECNFLNLAADSVRLAKQVDRPNVKVVVDYYHLALEKESPDVILAGADYIQHIHIARGAGRAFPGRSDPDGYQPFFSNLKRIHYNHRVSLEARTSDLQKDGAESLALLRGLLA